MELTRISRKFFVFDAVAKLADGNPATLAGVDVALLVPNQGPTAATVWTPATYVDPAATVLLAGPDAGGSGALVVPDGGADLWARITDTPEVDAARIERIVITDADGTGVVDLSDLPDQFVAGLVTGSTATRDALDARFVNEGQGAGGALSGSYPSPGLNETTVDSIVAGKVGDAASATTTALRAAYGRAAPVLSSFSYDATTGDLLSYQEDGITITLTYNADGTVATSKRGSEATQTYTYTGGNLTGVA